VVADSDMVTWISNLCSSLDPDALQPFLEPLLCDAFVGPVLRDGTSFGSALAVVLSDPALQDQVGNMLNELDHTLYNTLYGSPSNEGMWIHALIPAFSLTIFGVPLTFTDLDTWIAINCIYYGDYATRPAAPGYPNPWPAGGYW
jgi:hypothetical protein